MGVAFKGENTVAERLLADRCDVNATNNAGQTALMMAALFGRNETVKLLISHGVNAALRDDTGNTALSLAEQQRNAEMIALLGGK
jgi:ankyrin repeat protein